MDNQSIQHTRWNCTYHIVFIPKYRRNFLVFDEDLLARDPGGFSYLLPGEVCFSGKKMK
jgi:hypothetical protein